MVSGDGDENVAKAIEEAIEEGSRLPKGDVAGILTKLLASPLMVDFISQHGHAAEFTAQLRSSIRSKRLQEVSRTHQAQVDSQAQRNISDALIDDGGSARYYLGLYSQQIRSNSNRKQLDATT
jgi:hypothetical protein